jgi:uncharacterized damage-inducible protein DinB
MKNSMSISSPPAYPVALLAHEVEKEGRRTNRILLSMPTSFINYSPSDELRPVRELTRHVASVYLYVEQALALDEWDTAIFDIDLKVRSLKLAVRTLSDARQAAVRAAIGCPPERLDSLVEPFGFPERALTYLRRAVDHEIHHRGEICVYATLCGHSVGDLYECERGHLNSTRRRIAPSTR